MTGTNHGMTGAVIALLAKEPVIAVPLSYVSHYICDAIPHFGVKDKPGQPDDELFSKKFNLILAADFLFAVSMMIVLGFLFPDRKFVIWACMVAAASPDLMWIYYRLYREKLKKLKPNYRRIARFHIWIQWSSTYKGAFVELAWFVLASILILALR